MIKCLDCQEYFEPINYELQCKGCNQEFLDKLAIFEKLEKATDLNE